MSAKQSFIIINLLGLAGAIACFVMSSAAASFVLFGLEMSASAGFLILIAYVVGALIGACSIIPFVKGGQAENVAKLKEWQQQDAKLAIEVQKDKEKQLEAKIATLEAALAKALDRA